MEQSASISNRASILCVVLFPGRLLRYKALQRLSANCRNRIHQMYDTCIHMPQWNWYSEYRMYYKYVQVCTFIHSVCVCVIHVMCRLQNIHHWGKPWAELKKATCNNNKKNSQKNVDPCSLWSWPIKQTVTRKLSCWLRWDCLSNASSVCRIYIIYIYFVPSARKVCCCLYQLQWFDPSPL